MTRRARRILAILCACLASLLVGVTFGTASAATQNDTACRKGLSSPYSHDELLAYTACRDDKIDAALAGLDGTSSPAPTPTPTPTATASPTPTPTATSTPPAGAVCVPGQEAKNASGQRLVFNGNGSAGLGEYGIPGDYNASAELWGVNGYNYTQTMGVCSNDSWYVTPSADNVKNDGAVKSYPSMRRFYYDYGKPGATRRLSSFPKLTIDYASTDPNPCPSCIYDTAFDIWLNTNDFSKSTELMVWTHNVGQTPAGDKIATGVKVDGHTWDVWADKKSDSCTGCGGYKAFVPTDTDYLKSGKLDAKAFIAWLVTNQQIRDTGTALDQTDPWVVQPSYGVEIVSTGGTPRTWNFTKFTINDGS